MTRKSFLQHHSYFNLDGHGAGSIDGHRIRIPASRYTPSDPENIPTGEIAAVEGTPMDLRALTRSGGAQGQQDRGAE